MPILTIPTQREDSAAFRQRLADLIRGESTHIYIDTSFLMWMTKVGSGSRQELVDWLQHNCAGRVHVPIWSAHEYLKHHVARTIVAELSTKTKEVAGLAGRTYAYFRPFIDEPLGEGGEDPSVIRSEVRVTLNRLKCLTTKVGRWAKSYHKHASEVISFINNHTPDQTSIYTELDNINQTGSGRFMGSVPPGYKDRWKMGSDQQSTRSAGEVPSDSNRYGDLIFWKEVLLHARNMEASVLVVITNDRKNDWYMGGSDVGDIDSTLRKIRRDWKPVPRPHPMIVMEAKLVAKVEQVELLDSAYLAALLRDVAAPDVQAFADVAIIPDGPDPEKKGDEQAKLPEARRALDAAKLSAEPTDKQYLFSDSERVMNTRSHFRRALLESRNDIDQESEVLLQSWRTSVEETRPLSETITSETLHDFDHKKLTCLARELHDRTLQPISGYEEAVADLVSILDQLPPNTAASLYLGLLSSMYLLRKSNASRIPPSSPVAKLLFDRQSDDNSLNSVYAVARRLSDNEVTPLYLPNSDRPSVKVTLDIEPNAVTPNQLRSLTIQDTELLTPAQSDESLKLGVLFDSEGLTAGKAIIRKACELFAIPLGQVEPTDMFDQSYSLTETVGFRRPGDIAIPKGQANGE